MGIHSSHTRMLAVVGVLALGAASTVRAQDTTQAQPRDTGAAAYRDRSGYKSYQNPTDRMRHPTDTMRLPSDSMRKDSSAFKYRAPPTDTSLKPKPGAQTGQKAGDTTSMSGRAGNAGNAGATDSVVCEDGARAVVIACDAAHGGVDSAATKASKKARGKTEVPDTRDPSSSSSQQ